MSEKITTYMLRDPDMPVPMDRNEYYTEQIKSIESHGKAIRAVEVIALLLFNTDGEIILQKRSHEKVHNPYKIDKAIGGHVKWDDSPLYTLMVETVQELRVPSIVLRTDEDFKKTLKLLDNYLDNIAVVKELDADTFQCDRVINKVNYKIPNRVTLFIGAYEGSTKPVDKEASGVLYYNLDILKEEMRNNPDQFTGDLHFYLARYEKEIREFIEHLTKK